MKKLFDIKTILSLLFVFVLYLIIIFSMPANSYWVTDCGNKAISAISLAQNGTISINNPTANIDKNAKFFPYSYFHFSKLKDGKIYSFYPFYYTAINALSYKILRNSLYAFFINSALFFTLTFAVLSLLQKNLHLRFPPWALILTTALLTPCFFYSLVLWEYGLATLFTTTSLLFLTKFFTSKQNRHLLIGGFLLGLGCYIREECIILGIAIGLVFLYQRLNFKNLISYSIGAITATIPFFITNKIIYGSILGIHAVGYTNLEKSVENQNTNFIFERLMNFYIYLLSLEPNSPQEYTKEAINKTILILTPIILIFILGLIKKQTKHIKSLNIIALTAAAVSSLYLSTQYLKSKQPVLNMLNSKGLFTLTPILILGLIGTYYVLKKHSNQRYRFLLLISMVYTIIICFSLNQGVPGIIFGPRHFLIIIPTLVLLTIHGIRHFTIKLNHNQRMLTYLSIILLILSSGLIEFTAISTLYLKKLYSANVINNLQKIQKTTNNQYVVSDIFWLGEEMAGTFYNENTKFLSINKEDDLKSIVNLLKKNKIKSFTFILSDQQEFRKIKKEEIIALSNEAQIIPIKKLIFKQCPSYNLYFYFVKFNEKNSIVRAH